MTTHLRDLSNAELRSRLRGDGLRLQVGPFVYCLQTPVAVVETGLRTLYEDFVVAEPGGFADFHVGLRSSGWVHKLRSRLEFYVDHQRPFNRIAASQGYAGFEWGLNWCVSTLPNEYMKLHAAVVAKDDVAIIMPGLPGAGKSTLCAALGLEGWRVLSDEHALIPLHSSQVVPVYRPVSLKNESIGIIEAPLPWCGGRAQVT